MRQFLDANRSGRGPEIHHDEFALKILNSILKAIVTDHGNLDLALRTVGLSHQIVPGREHGTGLQHDHQQQDGTRTAEKIPHHSLLVKMFVSMDDSEFMVAINTSG